MDVNLKLNGAWFDAANAKGAKIKLGTGQEDGVSPMEAVLMAAGGCSGIDIVSILEKMRQPLEGLEIIVSGQRRENYPKYFQDIFIKYVLTGRLDADKVQRAIDLSLEKYCSVTNGLEPKSKITYEFVINNGGDYYKSSSL
ncbi:MAG: OsmC family protein [Eubacteriales bacterium]|nr:OsmC family protein [Eubacteriales bacterium]MDD3073136.1 OsmC family protein [Eubacteriales bacterium]MDD4078180.1 OsmC family protein [Eubacteriales bacterium]MDD4768567.1 OsmC family protein [Eubacteriales bacterium]